jgi:hypothetical protein
MFNLYFVKYGFNDLEVIMKSMVKILVTIMALSLATAPVFAAWPTGKMNKDGKVKHLVSTYGCDRSKIEKLKVPELNTLEAQLSAAAAHQAQEVVVQVENNNNDAAMQVTTDLALAEQVAPAVELDVNVGEKRGRNEDEAAEEQEAAADKLFAGMTFNEDGSFNISKFPRLDDSLQDLVGEKTLKIAQGKFIISKDAEAKPENAAARGSWIAFQPGGDKFDWPLPSVGVRLRDLHDQGAELVRKRREAAAHHAFLLKQNSLYQYFAPIQEQLAVLTRRDALVTEAAINNFITTVNKMIKEVRLELGIMSLGTEAEYKKLVKPFDDYAHALEVYVAGLEANKEQFIIEVQESLDAHLEANKAQFIKEVQTTSSDVNRSNFTRSFLVNKSLMIAATLACGVIGSYLGKSQVIPVLESNIHLLLLSKDNIHDYLATFNEIFSLSGFVFGGSVGYQAASFFLSLGNNDAESAGNNVANSQENNHDDRDINSEKKDHDDSDI